MARGDVQLTNPATKFFKWSGSEGVLSYYDKEKKENVIVETPFIFLLLDTFTTMKGYNEKDKENIWANEIKDIKTQKLNVRSGKQSIKIGLYTDIKANVIEKGGGYAQSCYIAYKNEHGELVIGNITMSGSSFSGGVHKPANKDMKDLEIGGWLSFAKNNKNDIYEKAIQIIGRDERVCTNGSVKFYAPVFKLNTTTEETNKKAIALTQVLKAYMTEYFKKNDEESHAEEVIAEQVNTAHQSVYGDTPATLTEQEKLHLVKEKPQDQSLPEMGNLPEEDNSFADMENGESDDLPF